MKDYIEEKYPQIYRSYPKLKAAILKAWEAIADENIMALINSMPEGYRAVIAAKGWHIEY